MQPVQNLTPEQMAIMEAQQEAQAGQMAQVTPQMPPQQMAGEIAPMIPQQMMPQGMPPQMEGEQGVMSEEDIVEAKRALGLDALENSMMYKENMADVLSEYPDLDKKTFEAELAKIEEQDPALAQQFKTSKVGMETFAKGLMSSIKPEAKPDEVTDDAQTSSQGASADEALEKKVSDGKANKFELGTYLGKLVTK